MGQAIAKVIPDTNILVRAVVADDAKQGRLAASLLEQSEAVVLTGPTLCEFVWVLKTVYRFSQQEISAVLETLLSADNVVVNRPSAEAGLAMVNAGGDFADGWIAYEGRWDGGEVFVSFDKQAVGLLTEQGERAELLR